MWLKETNKNFERTNFIIIVQCMTSTYVREGDAEHHHPPPSPVRHFGLHLDHGIVGCRRWRWGTEASKGPVNACKLKGIPPLSVRSDDERCGRFLITRTGYRHVCATVPSKLYLAAFRIDQLQDISKVNTQRISSRPQRVFCSQHVTITALSSWFVFFPFIF